MRRVYLRNLNKYAIVDDKDYKKVINFCWCGVRIYNTTYACARVDGKNRYMHRVILGAWKKGLPHIDHNDPNGLNNRRGNIKFTTVSKNILNGRLRINNTSGCTGVSYYKNYKMWEAYIMINKVKKRFGYFREKNQAIKARQNYMKELK